jgi:hypothetical protein
MFSSFAWNWPRASSSQYFMCIQLYIICGQFFAVERGAEDLPRQASSTSITTIVSHASKVMDDILIRFWHFFPNSRRVHLSYVQVHLSHVFNPTGKSSASCSCCPSSFRRRPRLLALLGHCSLQRRPTRCSPVCYAHHCPVVVQDRCSQG